MATDNDDRHPYRRLVLPKGALFELRPSPGKGWGAFATQDIKSGTTILDETPMFSIPKTPQGYTEQDLERAVTRLSDRQRAQLDLLRLGAPTGNITRASLKDTLHLNGFEALDAENRPSTGLLPIASRFNHSCVPNIAGQSQGTAMVFEAMVPIAAGAEITFAYQSPLECLTRQERQAKLVLLNGQPCRCDLCSGAPIAIYISDMRRRFVRTLYFLIFGYDLAAGLCDVSIKDLIPNACLRRAAQDFHLPMTSRVVYCSLASALLREEHLLHDALLDRLAWVIKEAAGSLERPDTKKIVWDLRADDSLSWRQMFEGFSTVFERADPGDEVGNAILGAKLGSMRDIGLRLGPSAQIIYPFVRN